MIPFDVLDALLMNVLMIGLIVAFAVLIMLGIVIGTYFIIKALYLDFKKTKRSDNNG